MVERASLGGKKVPLNVKNSKRVHSTVAILRLALKLDLYRQIKIQSGGLMEKIIGFVLTNLMVMKRAQHQIILVRKHLGLSGGIME